MRSLSEKDTCSDVSRVNPRLLPVGMREATGSALVKQRRESRTRSVAKRLLAPPPLEHQHLFRVDLINIHVHVCWDTGVFVGGSFPPLRGCSGCRRDRPIMDGEGKGVSQMLTAARVLFPMWRHSTVTNKIIRFSNNLSREFRPQTSWILLLCWMISSLWNTHVDQSAGCHVCSSAHSRRRGPLDGSDPPNQWSCGSAQKRPFWGTNMIFLTFNDYS